MHHALDIGLGWAGLGVWGRGKGEGGGIISSFHSGIYSTYLFYRTHLY